MRVGMDIEPFGVEYDQNYSGWGQPRVEGGVLRLYFFGHEIWSLETPEHVSEYVQDDIKTVALEELGKLLAEGMNRRVKPNEYDGVRIDG